VNITVKKGNLVETKTQAIILAFCEEDKKFSELVSNIDQKTGGLLSDIMKSGDFEGKPSQVSVIYTKSIAADRIALVGLGKKSELNL
jgi:leucyl aminopeptidase